MRLKGINPIEQHFEKIIAGVFALGLLGVVAWQFVGTRNSVKVGGQGEVPVDQAYNRVGEEARRVLSRLEAVNVEKPSGDVGTESLRQFQATFKGPVSPSSELAIALDKSTPVITTGGSGDSKPGAPIAELKLPQPAVPSAATHLATIDPSEIARDPAVASVLPKEQPFDKAAVSVETTIDGTLIKAALLADPDGDGPIQSIPKRWWESAGIEIIGVELERETLQSDKSWSQREIVKAMPGRQALETPLDQITTATAVKNAMQIAGKTPALVRRPDYYRVMFGDKWTAPSERGVDLGDTTGTSERETIQQEIEKIERSIKQMQDTLGKIGQPPPGGGFGGGGGGGGGAGGGGKGGRGGGGGGGGSQPPGSTFADESRKKQLQKRIDTATKQVEDLRKRLTALDGAANPAANDGAPAAPKSTEKPLLENSSVRLWAHDVYVERGKTYRYRVLVVLNNPFFGHAAAMLPEQAAWAKDALLRAPASEWSEPVSVEKENFLFITSATEDDQVSRASSARAEVYEFKWGYWRRGAVVLEPGDTVVAEIKYPDLSKVVAAAPTTGAPGTPAAPPPQSGGGKRGLGGGGAAGPGGGGNSLKGGGGAGDQPTEPKAPVHTAPMETIVVKRDTLLVGVSGFAAVDAGTGRATAAQQVLLREPGIGVVVRIPIEERDSPEYRRIARNADRGMKELEPRKGDPVRQDVPPPAPPAGDRDGGGPSGG